MPRIRFLLCEYLLLLTTRQHQLLAVCHKRTQNFLSLFSFYPKQPFSMKEDLEKASLKTTEAAATQLEVTMVLPTTTSRCTISVTRVAVQTVSSTTIDLSLNLFLLRDYFILSFGIQIQFSFKDIMLLIQADVRSGDPGQVINSKSLHWERQSWEETVFLPLMAWWSILGFSF